MLAFVFYLICLPLFPNLAFSEVYWENNSPVVINRVYLFLQFFSCIFIVNITSSVFGESFRQKSYEYLLTFPLSKFNIIFVRLLKLIMMISIIYIPIVLLLFQRVNESIIVYIDIFPQYMSFPLVNVFIPVVHCVIAVIFYIAVTLFLLSILKNDKLPTILIMAYCALEAGPLSLILGKYAIFRGAFNGQDYYSLFPPNIVIMMLLSILFITLIMLTYRRRV